VAGSLPGWTRPPRPACSTCWRRPSTPAGRCGGLATTSSSPSGGRTAGWAVGLAGSWRIDRRVGRRYTGCSRTRWPRSSPCSRSGGGRPVASQVGLPRLLLGPGVGVSAATGQLLRELVLDPTKRYQPTGRPPGPPRKRTRPYGLGVAVPPRSSSELLRRVGVSGRRVKAVVRALTWCPVTRGLQRSG